MPIHEKMNYVEYPSKNLEATKAFFQTAFGWSFADYGPEYAAFSDQGLDGGFCQSEDTTWGIGNNAIEVRGVPWLGSRIIPTPAVTIGNVILYADTSPTQDMQDHERQHTFQGETLGPLYLPVHIATQGASALMSAVNGDSGPPGPFHRYNPHESGPMSIPPIPW